MAEDKGRAIQLLDPAGYGLSEKDPQVRLAAP
jgi:hypothetical protein